MITELLKKFEGILTEEDITGIKSSIDTLINEAVEKTIDENIEELVESTLTKINEVKQSTNDINAREAADTIKKIRADDAKEAASYIQNLTENYAIEVAQYCKEREKVLVESLEEKMVDVIDRTIDEIINENFSEDIITKIAINETYKPIVEGMQSLLGSKLLEVDSEGYDTVNESKEIVKKQNELIESLNKKISDLSVLVESTKVDAEIAKAEKLLIEKTQYLSANQKKTVMMIAESFDTSLLESKLDTIIESVVSTENDDIEDEEESEGLTESSFSSGSYLDDSIVSTKKPIVNEATNSRNDIFSSMKRLVGNR